MRPPKGTYSALLCLVIIGVLMFVHGLFGMHYIYQLKRDGIKITGTITDKIDYLHDGSNSCKYRIQLLDSVRYDFESYIDYLPAMADNETYKIGETVELIYLKSDPDSKRINSFTEMDGSYLWDFLWGTILIVSAGLYYLFKLKPKRNNL